MGEVAAVLGVIAAVVAVIAGLVAITFGRDAHLLRGLKAFRARRTERTAQLAGAPRSWHQCDDLIRRGEALSSDTQKARALLDSDRLIATLERVYPNHPPVTLSSVRMPVWALPAPEAQRHHVDSILGMLAKGASPHAATYPDAFCPGGAPTFWRKHEERKAMTEDDRRHLASNPTYSMTQARIGAGGQLALDCRMGRYFTHLATTRAMGHELLGALSRTDGPVALEQLPMRRWLHANVEDPVLDGSRRDAALGISTLIVQRRREGGYYALLPTRSGRTATDATLMHVCPAGMLQPFSDSPVSNVNDFSVMRNFSREYVEELYSIEAAERPLDHFDEFDGDSSVPLQRLAEHLESTPASSLRLSGFCVNLITLQPEICLLLFIDDPDWLARESRRDETDFPLKFSWEVAEVGDHPRSWLMVIDDDLEVQPDDPLRVSNLVPQAAATLRLGLDLLREDRISTSGREG